MEALLLAIYSFFVWLIFFKFKWLPWNATSQVIVITLPIFGMTALTLALNVVAPSSADVRVLKYVININPQVRGRVIDSASGRGIADPVHNGPRSTFDPFMPIQGAFNPSAETESMTR